MGAGSRRGQHGQTTTAPDGIKVDIDLKRGRRIKEIVWWQGGDRNFLMRYITVYLSNDGKGWSRVTGQITASITSPGGMGTQIEFPGGGRTARWVRVHTQGNAAYYRGVGEIEIYEQPVTGSPQGLTCLAQSDGSVKLEWKMEFRHKRPQLARNPLKNEKKPPAAII